MNNTFFSFNNEFYKQTFSLPMGSPLVPICADLVMGRLEEICINKLNYDVPFFYRYVDDITTAIPMNGADEIMCVFNNYHLHLQFTFELEVSCKQPFLDVMFIRRDKQLIVDWYQKLTFSARMLNFKSNHPTTHKTGMVKSLVDRVIKMSDNEFSHKHIAESYQYLRRRNSRQGNFMETTSIFSLKFSPISRLSSEQSRNQIPIFINCQNVHIVPERQIYYNQ